MPIIKFIGKKTNLYGNTLWEIVSNLKNFGVGRVVVRSAFERYEEKSFMRILKVEANPNPVAKINRKVIPPPEVDPDSLETRTVKVWVEKVFRGKKYDQPICIELSSDKPDFKLISKKDEAEYCKLSPREEKILPAFMDLPPLLREFVEKETGQKDFKIKIHHKEALFKDARIAKEGEKPNVEVSMGLGKPHPKSMHLYQGIEL